MSRSTRVLVLNNYPLAAVWQAVRQGDKPDHHLYGVNHLQAMGYEVQLIEPAASSAITAMAGLLKRLRNPIPLGALDRQWAAWRCLREGDVIYAPCGDELTSLAYLRGAGLLKTPLIALQHHALNRGRLAAVREPMLQLMVHGMDAYPALSRRAAAQINQRCQGRPAKSSALTWGPDATFYPRSDEPGRGALAAGRTGRDFLTFGRGATRAGTPAQILCLAESQPAAFGEFGPTVQVRTAGPGRVYSYPEMMRDHLAARVIAIPLDHSEDNLAGLTSLVDALALGKPVVMTRNPFIDLDVEALGVGRWVDAGDVEGWAQALKWFEAHPDESLAMGRRARHLVDAEGCNSRCFAERIDGLIQGISGAPIHRPVTPRR